MPNRLREHQRGRMAGADWERGQQVGDEVGEGRGPNHVGSVGNVRMYSHWCVLGFKLNCDLPKIVILTALNDCCVEKSPGLISRLWTPQIENLSPEMFFKYLFQISL